MASVTLPIRRPPYQVPSFSLTGDLLSFRKCGLQYRYLNGSALPPSRPVQMWFGEFIHGVLELALRGFQQGAYGSFPWNDDVLTSLCDTVTSRLRSQGKTARSQRAEDFARRRASLAINQLGPLLFPLVDTPEVTLSGTRDMPQSASFRARYYEVTGRIDVLTNVALESVPPGTNAIVDMVRNAVEVDVDGRPFEVIVDYKGTRRPSTTDPEWQLYAWQLQTYAWLRQRQPDSLPVRAGLLIFINELLPSATDMRRLQGDIANNATDVRPANNTPDLRTVLAGPVGDPPFGLSWDFRVNRALLLVNVSGQDQVRALARFDGIVGEIESAVNIEQQRGTITQSWPTYPSQATCVACDFRTMCPSSMYRGPALAPLGTPGRTPDVDD